MLSLTEVYSRTIGSESNQHEELDSAIARHLQEIDHLHALIELEKISPCRFRGSHGQSDVEFLRQVARSDLQSFQERVDYFSLYLKNAQETVAQGQRLSSLRREGSLLWRTLASFDLRPPSNLFDLLGEHEVVEIYDTQMRQIFRNLRFFEVSSYSMEELLHIPLPRLFERTDESMQILMKEIVQVFAGELNSARISAAGKSRAREIHSRRQLQGEIEQRVLSPIFDRQGKVAAVLGSIRLELDNAEDATRIDPKKHMDQPALSSV
jgi:PAS domain-containing protein